MQKSAEREQVRESIERNNARAVRSYSSGDVETLVSLCAEDVWQLPPHNPALVGREAIRNFWTQALQWGTWEFTLDTEDVEVGGDIAVERGKYVLQFTANDEGPPGTVSFVDRGNYLTYWRHEPDGEWRLVCDAPVSELPLPVPSQD